jgi:beta propeller repeat protein
MIVLQPILPLYAADEAVAPPPPETVSSDESPPPPPTEVTPDVPPGNDIPGDDPAPAPTETVVPEDTPPVNDEELPSPPTPVETVVEADIPPVIGDEEVSSSSDSVVDIPLVESVLGVATSTDAGTTTETVPEEVMGGSTGVGTEEVKEGTTTPVVVPITQDEEATTTLESVASLQEEGLPHESADDLSVTTTPSDDQGISAEEVMAAENRKKEEEARTREELLRRELRKEVEAEFTKGCVSLEHSGYYCLKDTERGWSGDLSPSMGITAVSSESDTKGSDKEIFVTKGGQKIQLTDNEQEDAFPAFDFDGNTVVWQEMNNGRWQIFYAEVASATPEVHQLTNSMESNFNPTVHSGVIAWQGWVDGNWEIFLARPRTGEPALSIEQLTPEHRLVGVNGDWDVERLTTNATHDMFPAIAGDLVTWQSYEAGNWGIVAYSLKTGTLTRVSDGTKKSERPRFALLWEEEGSGGNMHMKGYDIASGKTTDLTDEAKRVPDAPKSIPPAAPITGTDQAALPSAVVQGSVTSQKDDRDDDDSTGTSTPSV